MSPLILGTLIVGLSFSAFAESGHEGNNGRLSPGGRQKQQQLQQQQQQQ